MKLIDLNADLGESAIAIANGTQQQLLQFITSANIACGGHAGDEATMRTTLEQCRQHHVAIGAHPSYPDRTNFGRTHIEISPADLAASLTAQVESLIKIADELGVKVTHLKPHGALYNAAAQDARLAQTIVDSVRHHPHLILYGLRGSVMLDVFREAGFRTARETFADRAYQPDGTLRPRHLPGAVLTDPHQIAANILDLTHQADTICIHSDTKNAIAIAQAVRAALTANAIALSQIQLDGPPGP